MDGSGLTKEIIIWSLALTWCFQVRKLLNHIHLGDLNPTNATSLSPREFQTIITSKLIDKANHQ